MSRLMKKIADAMRIKDTDSRRVFVLKLLYILPLSVGFALTESVMEIAAGLSSEVASEYRRRY